MDIARISMDLAQSRVQSAFGTAILAKELGIGQEQGDEMVEMIDSARAAMELSVNPGVGANFDVSV